MVRLVFWVSLLLVGYAYLGYPLVLFLIGQLRGWLPPIAPQSATPSVSILIAARNEAANLAAKLDNLSSLDYPPHLLEIIVVSDGSTDSTAAILAQAVPKVFAVLLDVSVGKALALNEAVSHATGDILVFLDARQSVDANAVSELVSCFADPEIGAVSGELLLASAVGGDATSGGPGEALGLYWKIEKAVRRLESAVGRPLVERSGRGSKFTKDGEQLLGYARRILALHDDALHSFGMETPETVVIGSTEHAAAQLLPALAVDLEQLLADYEVRLRIDRGTRLREALAAGRVDVALLLGPAADPHGVRVGELELTW